jgi:hypothetical protein
MKVLLSRVAPTGVADYSAALLPPFALRNRRCLAGHMTALYTWQQRSASRYTSARTARYCGMHDAVLQHLLLGTLAATSTSKNLSN